MAALARHHRERTTTESDPPRLPPAWWNGTIFLVDGRRHEHGIPDGIFPHSYRKSTHRSLKLHCSRLFNLREIVPSLLGVAALPVSFAVKYLRFLGAHQELGARNAESPLTPAARSLSRTKEAAKTCRQGHPQSGRRFSAALASSPPLEPTG
ncbi:MAG: hypothetical protein GY854_24945 [Deltaproteobacteria bacterium]|nr:hypothetical protein [Deltaproteobacteria bacterium]